MSLCIYSCYGFANEVGLAQEQKFAIPMYFELREDSVKILPAEFEYDLSLDGSRTLRVGNVIVNQKSFGFGCRTLGQLLPQMKGSVTDSELNQSYLFLKWPTQLIAGGQIEMVSQDGQVFWRSRISADVINRWQKQVEVWKSTALTRVRGAKASDLKSGLFQAQIGFPIDLSQASFSGQRSYRFCLSQKSGRAYSKLCSSWYVNRKKESQLIMAKLPSELRPRVLLQNAEAPLKGVVQAPQDLPMRFYADLSFGESYEFIAQPAIPQLMEVSAKESEGKHVLIGYGIPPNQQVTILNPDTESSIAKALGLESTIKDNRKFWSLQIPREQTDLYFPGQGGGLFHQKFEFQSIPSDQLRPFLSTRLQPGTYSDGAYVPGRKNVGMQVSTEQNSVTLDPKDPELFYWRFGAKDKGEINRSYLTISNETQSARAYYELYRGYGNELSGRFSAILSANETINMGELAFNHWFENIFGWENYYIAKQRWGLSYKQFQSLNSFVVGQAGETANLQVSTLDLKYRFTPGLWTRDESWGLMANYQTVAIDPLSTSMMGVGWFWARSMPRSLDQLFSRLPFMNYPKWVDMEMVYYVSSNNSQIALAANYAINFHGQVLWKKWFFGEAGFGMKRYAFTDTALDQQFELNTFYGTVGMGIKF